MTVRKIVGPKDIAVECDGMLQKLRVRDSSLYRIGMDVSGMAKRAQGYWYETVAPKQGRTV